MSGARIRIDFTSVGGHVVAIAERPIARGNRASTGDASFRGIGQRTWRIARTAMHDVGLHVRLASVGIHCVAILKGSRARRD